jgi:hypothetical protein
MKTKNHAAKNNSKTTARIARAIAMVSALRVLGACAAEDMTDSEGQPSQGDSYSETSVGSAKRDEGAKAPVSLGAPNPGAGVGLFDTKGTDYNVINQVPGLRVTIECEDSADNNFDAADGMRTGHCELEKSTFSFGKTMRFKVKDSSGKEIFHKYMQVNPVDGTLIDGNFGDTANDSPVQFVGDVAISAGFYDAPTAPYTITGTTNQAYVYVTPRLNHWMSDKSDSYSKPLSAWTLPGSHDAGMYKPSNAFGSILDRRVDYAANTQKDSIADQLNMGVRFFDFRPGYAIQPVALRDAVATCVDYTNFDVDAVSNCVLDKGVQVDTNNIRHIHSIFAGESYDTFLDSVVQFLNANPKEIVVVNVKTDGMKPQMIPSNEVLQGKIDDALKRNGASSSLLGGARDFDASYGALVRAGRRMLVTGLVAGNTLDSYELGNYKEQGSVPTFVTQAVNTCSTSYAPEGKIATILQMQATAQGSAAGLIEVALARTLGAPLYGSRIALDRQLLPIAKDANQCDASWGPTIMLNDYADNGFASQVILHNR